MRTIVALALTLPLLGGPAHANECWDKRIQLTVPCEHLESEDALLPGKECWHADYQSFDICAIESFEPGYRHKETPRERCEAEGKRLNWETGACIGR